MSDNCRLTAAGCREMILPNPADLMIGTIRLCQSLWSLTHGACTSIAQRDVQSGISLTTAMQQLLAQLVTIPGMLE